MKLKIALRHGFGFGRTATSDWYGFLTHDRFVRISAFSSVSGKMVCVPMRAMSGSS